LGAGWGVCKTGKRVMNRGGRKQRRVTIFRRGRGNLPHRFRQKGAKERRCQVRTGTGRGRCLILRKRDHQKKKEILKSIDEKKGRRDGISIGGKWDRKKSYIQGGEKKILGKRQT